nr:hypothetical protein [Parachlamydiaceae bacterium]
AEKIDITVKCVEKCFPDEPVGVLVNTGTGVAIVEYSEKMSEKERRANLPDGTLKHRCSNISLFCFSMDFIKKNVGSTNMPWHLTAKPIYSNGPIAWKFETFIFDYLASTNAIKALLYPRERAFAPLKNGAGKDSLETVQQALIKYDIATLEGICGHSIPFCRVELDQQFHYPTEELLSEWKGRAGPFECYIRHNIKPT